MSCIYRATTVQRVDVCISFLFWIIVENNSAVDLWKLKAGVQSSTAHESLISIIFLVARMLWLSFLLLQFFFPAANLCVGNTLPNTSNLSASQENRGWKCKVSITMLSMASEGAIFEIYISLHRKSCFCELLLSGNHTHTQPWYRPIINSVIPKWCEDKWRKK